MKGKKFLAALLVASMLCPNSIIYASEASETEVETEVSEEVPVISEDNGIETSVSISTDKIDIEIDEESYFYVDGIPSDEEITVTVENEAIAAVTAVTADMVEDTVKQNTPDTALWYSVKGIEVGETFITILVGEEEKEIAVHVTAIEEDINEDNEAEQEEQPLEGEEPEDEGQTENELAPEYIEDQQLQQMMEGQDAVVFSEEGYEVGWKEEADGTRYYINDAGQFYTGIAEIDGVLYYFDETTGYLCTTGQWINKDGKKYFCNEKGVLYRDQFIKFDTTYYYMGNDGSVQTGVFSTGDTLRYADEKTGIVQMTSGWINFDGKKFFANEEGILYQRQFIKFGDIHYYMGTDGSVQLGTFRVGGVWYHSNSSTGELKLELGWIEDNGKKYYAGEGGVIFVNQFIKFGTTYYYMGSDGSVQTGTFNVDGEVYYADPTSGIIRQESGWITHDGKEYFGKGDGTLYTNQFIKFGTIYYYMGADGSVQKGIVNVDGTVYYADPNSGVIQEKAGWINYDGKDYFGKGDGTLYTNQFIKFGTTYYYMGSDGSVQKGIVNVNGVIYFADPDNGIIRQESGWINYDGKKYFGKGDMTLYSNQFITFGDTYYYMGADGSLQKGIVNANGVIYFADPDTGIIQKTAGWRKYNGKDYFSTAEGILYSNQFIKFGDTYYYMGADGSVQKGVVNANGVIYFADPDTGIIQRTAGWLEYDGKKYFSKEDGVLYSNQFITFGDIYYYMGSDGSVQKGIINANGVLYYADPKDGVVQKTAGWIEYNGKKYFANEIGILYKNQFITFGADCYYMGSDGSVQKGEQLINGQWYYFNEKTGLLERKPGWFTSGSHKYYQNADGTLATGYTDIDGIRYYFDSTGALASRVGIDVSYYQGNIDWKKVKAAGIEFVFVRAGYRGYSNGRLVKDSCFDQNMQGALAAGLEVGVYFFSQAINVQEAQEEATFTYNLIKTYDVTFPVAFDAEYATSGRTGRADHLSPSTRTLVVNAFCSQIKSYGYTPMLYAGIYFMRDELQMNLLSNYQLWIPRYNSTLGYDGEYKCWQYTSEGRVNGISGNVDMNVWLN